MMKKDIRSSYTIEALDMMINRFENSHDYKKVYQIIKDYIFPEIVFMDLEDLQEMYKSIMNEWGTILNDNQKKHLKLHIDTRLNSEDK